MLFFNSLRIFFISSIFGSVLICFVLFIKILISLLSFLIHVANFLIYIADVFPGPEFLEFIHLLICVLFEVIYHCLGQEPEEHPVGCPLSQGTPYQHRQEWGCLCSC